MASATPDRPFASRALMATREAPATETCLVLDSRPLGRWLGVRLRKSSTIKNRSSCRGQGRSRRHGRMPGSSHGDGISTREVKNRGLTQESTGIGIQWNSIGSGERGRFNNISKRFATPLRIGSGPRVVLLLKKAAVLKAPVGATITPEEEGDQERLTAERSEIENKEANRFRGNREFESAVAELRDKEMGSQTADGSLKQDGNRIRRKAKLASPKGSHQEEGDTIKSRVRDSST